MKGSWRAAWAPMAWPALHRPRGDRLMDTKVTDPKTQAPDPDETARVLQQVADRSAKLLSEFAKKDFAASMSAAASDELGIAKAYMDLYSRMLANPAGMAAFSTNLMLDYMQLRQSS